MDKPKLDLSDRDATLAALAQMSREDLLFLNEAVVDQLKTLRQAFDAQSMAQFSVGDTVIFTDKNGEQRLATVQKLNKKTVNLITVDDEQWRVSPHLLELAAPPKPDNVIDLPPNQQPEDSRQRTLPLGKSGECEWVGGRLPSPGYVTGEGAPYKPELFAWMNAEQFVVGMAVVEPSEFEAQLLTSLRNAIDAPMAGESGAPDRIRVADPELIAPLSKAFPKIEFIQGATPELAELGHSMQESMQAETEKVPGYLESGAEPAAVGAMFKAAAGLYRAAPWASIPHDQCLIGVSVPALGISDAVVSVIGGKGQNFGFLFFPTLAGHEQYLLASDCLRRGMEAETPAYTALTFESGADIEPSRRKEISEQGWDVVDANAYPDLFTPDADRVVRPISPTDITLAMHLCSALPELFETIDDPYAAWSSTAGTREYPVVVANEHEELVDLIFTVPFPYHKTLRASQTSSDLMAELLVRGRSSNDIDLDDVEPLLMELQAGYCESPECKALGKNAISISPVIVQCAAGYMNATIPTLFPADLEEVLFDILPRNLSIEPDDADECIRDVRAFYQYLGREHGLEQADACLDLLTDEAVERFAAALADEDSFGMGKSILELGKSLGYDTSTPEGITALMQAMERGDLPANAGSGLPGLPFPESPPFDLPTVKPVDKKARKNRRKSARKARKKNR